jgi:hypothetical protein
MGGDLNLKKSWHPVLMSNQKKVWEEEKKALDERKKTEQRIKELKEERAKEEIQKKLEAAGSRKRVDRVDWMYQGPSSGQAGTTEEMEGYLLGKRRIDGLIKGNEHKKLEKQASEDSFMALQHANTLRDTAAKVREDPMLAIKRQEQAAYEAMMNDPIKRRQMLALMGQGEEKPAKKEKKHRRHHHRHRDDSGDERRHKRRRMGDEEEKTRSSRHHHRRPRSGSRTPDSRSASPDRQRDGREERGRRRRDSRSASPRRKPDDNYRGSDNKDRDVDRRRRLRSSSSKSRSPSPDRRRKSYPTSRNDRDDRRDHYPNYDRGSNRPRGDIINGNRNGGEKKPAEDIEAERQRKLAAMQQDASELDADREKRLAALAEREKADREADDQARAKSARYGDKADFVNGMHRKAGDMGLADRIGRGRQGLQRDD